MLGSFREEGGNEKYGNNRQDSRHELRCLGGVFGVFCQKESSLINKILLAAT